MNANLQRFLGGSPGAVLVKLIFLSLLVGAFMALIGITPVGLFERILRMLREVCIDQAAVAEQRVAGIQHGLAPGARDQANPTNGMAGKWIFRAQDIFAIENL